jgi:hypothetical protein
MSRRRRDVGKSCPCARDSWINLSLQVPYPLISLVMRLPLSLQGLYPLTFHTRTFETFSLAFGKESDTNDVFESVKELTVASTLGTFLHFSFYPLIYLRQRLLLNYTHSFTPPTRHFPPAMVGQFIPPEKNSGVWGLAQELKHGGSLT